MKKININIHKKNSVLYLIICGGIILIIVLAIILPYHFKISKQVKENDKLKYQIQEQKELAPVHEMLIHADENKDTLVLPHPERTVLPRAEAQKFQTDFKQATMKSGLKLIELTPDINTSASPSNSFLHHIVLKGELANFRKLLIELGTIPYVDRIEEMNIQQNTGSMDFKLKVWIAIN